MTRFLWFLLVAALLAGQAIAAEPLQVERRQIDRKLPGCGNAKDGCVHVSFDYVEALSGPPAVRAKINSAVIGVLLWRPGNDPRARSRITRRDSSRIIRNRPSCSRTSAGSFQRRLRSCARRLLFFGLGCWEESYTGGAHPYSATQYLNVDAETGEGVTLAAVLRQRQQIKVSTRLVRGGVNGVIPVAMKFVLFQVHSPNFLIRYLPAGRVFPTIQTAGHLEPFGCRRARDQIHDRLIIAKRLAAPIRGDERE